MNKIRVIDLLNKIAKGEIPKKIKYDDSFYTFDKSKDNYYENATCSINWYYVVIHCLNDEVEILEEEKKIPEKLDTLTYINRNTISVWNEHRDKINEIIDYLKIKGDE